jgi:hypothetical protein
MRLSGDYVIPDLAFRALKSAGAAFFEPNLDHLSLKAILVLASGKFSAEIFDQVLAATATSFGLLGTPRLEPNSIWQEWRREPSWNSSGSAVRSSRCSRF